MYCPKCRAEYREGFTRCSDCNVGLVEFLSPQGPDVSGAEQAERPDLATTRYFLAWFVPMGVYVLVVFAAWARPFLRRDLFFVLFLVGLSMAALNGGFWMLYQAVRHERRVGRYVLLAFVPFMFVWYSLVRVPLRKGHPGESAHMPSDSIRGGALMRGSPVDVADENSVGNMFCPLCKAEYRSGFTQCSDCHIPLVASRKEAFRRSVERVWKGTNKNEFESVLTLIKQAEIPMMFREHLHFRPTLGLRIFGIPIFRWGRGTASEFEVTVLSSDANRARRALRGSAERDANATTSKTSP